MARTRTGKAGIAALGRIAALAPLIAAAGADAQDAGPIRRLQQPPQVLARYPDLPIRLGTPAFQGAEPRLTTQVELEKFVQDLAETPRADAAVTRLSLGTTPGGRDVPALLISRGRAASPAALSRLGRPIVLLIGQQHGNEPAGAEAALAIAAALADGDLAAVLGRLSVVIVPRANPDGAGADSRENAAGADINRDHGLMSQPEVRMLHRLVLEAPPALVIDAHEFTVGRRWVEKLGGLQAVDLMLLSSTHPMTPAETRKLAEDVFQPAIEKAIGAFRLTSFVYHTTSARAGDRSISVGGNAAGIARNAFGLTGAIAFLLETRGVGIGLDSYQRRVATHVIAIRALLETAAAHPAELDRSMAAARTAATAAHGDIVVAHTAERTATLLPLVDPQTGEDKIAAIDMLDTRVVAAVERRARPAGYIVAADRMAAIRAQLDHFGTRVCAFSRPAEALVERFDILKRAPSDARAINPERSLTVVVRTDRVSVAAGAAFIPLGQPAGLRLALALEPDTPGSLTAQSADADKGRLGVARLPIPSLTPEVAAAMSCEVPKVPARSP